MINDAGNDIISTLITTCTLLTCTVPLSDIINTDIRSLEIMSDNE